MKYIITAFLWIITWIMLILVAIGGYTLSWILWLIVKITHIYAICCCCGREFERQCFFWKNSELAWGKCNHKLAHLFLTIFFPHLFTKYLQEEEEEKEDGNFVIVNLEDEEEQEVHLIDGKVFDEEELIPYPKHCHGKKIACCYTYTYFIVATILALLWLIAMTVENAIYRKTGTCNDINVLDSSFTCFDITNGSYEHISCEIGSDPDITVFCYLYSPNPGAVGIAVGIVNLIFFVITAYFRLTTKMAENKSLIGLVIGLQAVLVLFTVITCIVLLVVHFRFKAELYFFQGNAAMRWAIFLLIPITAAALIPVPWCFFTNPPVHGFRISRRKSKSKGNNSKWQPRPEQAQENNPQQAQENNPQVNNPQQAQENNPQVNNPQQAQENNPMQQAQESAGQPPAQQEGIPPV